ncbi:MAG: hypothetical protein Q9161_007675 [Pseudevernia consocians]
MKKAQNIKRNVGDSTAEIKASVSGERPRVLANVDPGVVIAEVSNRHRSSKAIALRAEVEAQERIGSSYIRCVTECGNPIGYYRHDSTQEQSTGLLRPGKHSVSAELEHGFLIVSGFTAGLEGFPRNYEFVYNRTNLPDGTRSNDLRGEITFLRKNLCSLLLQPMAKPGSHEQTQSQVVDALREGKADLNAAEGEEEEQNVHEQTTTKISDPEPSEFPMTTGHLEIQAVNEAVKKISNALLNLKNVIKDLPSQLSQGHHTILNNDPEGVSRDVLRFPDCLTSLLVRRTAELDATRKDRDAAAETLRAAEVKMVAAEAKQSKLVAKTEAFERDKIVADEKMTEAAELLRAVETREKLVAGRERRVARLEEEQALEDLSCGANAAMEDGAEAAAAEARENEQSISPSARLTAAVDNARFPTGLEKMTITHPARGHVLLGKENVIAAREELWHRENNLAFQEINLHYRETALFAREQLLEQMKIAQVQLVENWKAQVDTSYAGLEAEGEEIRAKFRGLIALKDRLDQTQAKVRSLIGEARDMIERSGKDAGEDKSA